MRLFDPFYIDNSSVELNPTQKQLAEFRIACLFGARAEFSPLAYIILLLCIMFGTQQGLSFFMEFWFLSLALCLVSLWRFREARKLALAQENNYRLHRCNYYWLSLLTAFLWGGSNSMMLWIDQLGPFSFMLIALTIATTAGSMGTMAPYPRTSWQFIVIKWIPLLSVFIILTMERQPFAMLILFLTIFMLVFVLLQARRISLDLQNNVLREIQLVDRGDELSAALTKIEQQQQEVKQHRDHLQELVDEQTADLIEARDRAEQATQTKSEFLANMSHELRTPLHSILSFSELGRKRLGRVANEQVLDYLNKINVSAEMQLRMVNDLLDLARMESEAETLNLQRHNLLSIVQMVVDELSSLYEEKNITILIEDPMAKVYIHCDEYRIRQVLRNVLANAIKFSPEKGQVSIRVYKSSGSVRMEIEDQGPGVLDAEKELIFNKFNQSSRTRHNSGGTGLGLAICAQIMHAHKGDIWVEDARNDDADAGALFIVLFPPLQETS